MALANDLRSIPELFGDVVEQVGKLIQNEAQLARAEISEKATQAAMGAAYIAGAGILVVPVLVMLLTAFAIWLTGMGLSAALSYLSAAGLGAVLAVILAFVGMTYLAPKNLTPRVTIQQVQRDAVAAKELTR